MKITKKETEIYIAFDGKEFVNESDCKNYEEKNIENFVTKKLLNFDVIPPTNELDYTYTAFKVTSKEDFDLLYNYVTCKYKDIYGIEDYSGNGFYLVTFPDSDWVEINLLEEILKSAYEEIQRIIKAMLDLTIKENND